MIFAVEAPAADAAPEPGRSAYLSKKDLKIAVVALLLLAALLTPIYLSMQEDSRQHLCKQNLNQIQKAIAIYMDANNDRFPPIYDMNHSTGAPAAIDGVAATWITQIAQGMERRASFVCPSAWTEEQAHSLNATEAGKTIPSTYGMYAAWSAYPVSLMARPEHAVILAETSNHGARDTWNPHPFRETDDGFAIGWNDGNLMPTSKTSTVTRLAFFGTKDGRFREDGPRRHAKGIHVLFASGSLGILTPNQAQVSRLGKEELVGAWSAP